MKTLLFTLLALPTVALADDDEFYRWLGNDLDSGAPRNNQLTIGVQPILPVPNDRGPWGTGYSVVTTERVIPDIGGMIRGDEDAKRRETVQKVVPNDAIGNPLRGFDW